LSDVTPLQKSIMTCCTLQHCRVAHVHVHSPRPVQHIEQNAEKLSCRTHTIVLLQCSTRHGQSRDTEALEYGVYSALAAFMLTGCRGRG
jgi:hypothetical protein